MSQEVASLFIKVDSTGVVTASKNLDDFSGKAQKTEDSTRKVTKATDSANVSFTQMATAVKALAASYAALKMAEYIKDATMLAARYEMLGVTMRVAGKTAGYTGAQMEAAAQGMQKMGISLIASRENAMKMVVAQLDLAKAGELARIAQDVARVANINSSEAFTRMIQGIRSGETEIFKTMGLMINIDKAYRDFEKTNNLAKGSIDASQRAQAIMNSVLIEGEKYVGLYAATMDTAAGQTLSMERHVENLKVAFGLAFTPALAEIIENLTGAVKGLSGELSGDSKSAITSWGKEFAGNVSTIISAIKTIGAPIIAVIKYLWDFKDIIIAIGITFAAFKFIYFVNGLIDVAYATTMATTAMKLLQVACIDVNMALGLLALNPVAWDVLAIAAALGACYFAYRKFNDANDEAIEKLNEFENKANGMDLTHLNSEIDLLSEKLKNFGKDKPKTLWNPFGWFEGDIKSATKEQLQDMLRYAQTQKEVLATEQRAVTAHKQFADATAKEPSNAAKGAKKSADEAANLKKQMTKQAVEDTRKATYEIDSIGMSQYQKDLDRITAEADKFKKAGVDKVTITKYTETEMALAKRKSFEVDAENARKMYEELQKGKEEYETLLDALQSATLNAHDKALHEISKAEDEVYKKIEKLLDEAKISWEQADVLFKLVPKKRQQEIPERLTAERDMYQDLRGYEDSYYAASTALIEKQAERYRDLKINEVAIEAWATEEKRKAQLLLYRTVSGKGTFSGGMSQGAEDYTKSLGNYFTQGEEIAKSSATAMHNSLQNIFFDGIKGQLKSFSDYWTSFTDSLLQTFTNMLADMVAKWIMNQAMMESGSMTRNLLSLAIGVTGSVGSSGGTPSGMNSLGSYNMGGSTAGYASYFHSGGIVGESYSPTRMLPAYAFAEAPRYHNGLSTDEFPAILQRGERVLSRKEVAQGGGNISFNIPMTINALGKIKAAQISDLRNTVEEAVEKKIRSWS